MLRPLDGSKEASVAGKSESGRNSKRPAEVLEAIVRTFVFTPSKVGRHWRALT